MGEILPKTCFSPQSEPIELYYAFLLVRSIFGEVHTEPLFLVKKVTSQKRAQKYSESLLLFTSLKWEKIMRKILICLNNFF